jgi:hypothetical protein
MIMLYNEDEKELRSAQDRNEPVNYMRKLPWENEAIECIDQTGNTLIFHSLSADYFYISTRQKYVACGKYRVIVNNNNEILWAGRYDGKHFFIVSNNQLYALWYEHGIICIMPSFCTGDAASLDEIINKSKPAIDHSMSNGEYTYTRLFFSEFMKKEFYLRGPKWQAGKYPNDITILKSIINCNDGLLKIEIENITYPLDAHVLFDIENLKIIDGKTSMDTNTKSDTISNDIKDDAVYKKIRNIMVDVFTIDENCIKMDTTIIVMR